MIRRVHKLYIYLVFSCFSLLSFAATKKPTPKKHSTNLGAALPQDSPEGDDDTFPVENQNLEFQLKNIPAGKSLILNAWDSKGCSPSPAQFNESLGPSDVLIVDDYLVEKEQLANGKWFWLVRVKGDGAGKIYCIGKETFAQYTGSQYVHKTPKSVGTRKIITNPIGNIDSANGKTKLYPGTEIQILNNTQAAKGKVAFRKRGDPTVYTHNSAEINEFTKDPQLSGEDVAKVEITSSKGPKGSVGAKPGVAPGFINQVRHKAVNEATYKPEGVALSTLRRKKWSLVQIPLKGDNSIGPCGSYHYDPDGGQDAFASATTACLFSGVLQKWKEQELAKKEASPSYPIHQIQWGDISSSRRRFYHGHKSHTDGECIDLRPMKVTANHSPISHGQKNYNQKATAALVKTMKELGGNPVLFNDTSCGTTHWDGHDNHIHVCFKDTAANRERCKNFTFKENVCPELFSIGATK